MEPLPRFFPLERVIAFSDGVFAVVITLLVLGIDVPSDGALDAAAIATQRIKFMHQVLIYAVAFSLVGMYWSQHSLLYGGLRRVDRRLVVLNLFFLLPVSFLPFVTQLMGTRRDDWKAVLVFSVANLCATFLFERQWNHVAARPELQKDPETGLLSRRIRWAARFFGVVLIVGVLVSLLDVKAGTLLILIVPLMFFVNFLRLGPPSPADPASSDPYD